MFAKTAYKFADSTALCVFGSNSR